MREGVIFVIASLMKYRYFRFFVLVFRNKYISFVLKSLTLFCKFQCELLLVFIFQEKQWDSVEAKGFTNFGKGRWFWKVSSRMKLWNYVLWWMRVNCRHILEWVKTSVNLQAKTAIKYACRTHQRNLLEMPCIVKIPIKILSGRSWFKIISLRYNIYLGMVSKFWWPISTRQKYSHYFRITHTHKSYLQNKCWELFFGRKIIIYCLKEWYLMILLKILLTPQWGEICTEYLEEKIFYKKHVWCITNIHRHKAWMNLPPFFWMWLKIHYCLLS